MSQSLLTDFSSTSRPTQIWPTPKHLPMQLRSPTSNYLRLSYRNQNSETKWSKQLSLVSGNLERT